MVVYIYLDYQDCLNAVSKLFEAVTRTSEECQRWFPSSTLLWARTADRLVFSSFSSFHLRNAKPSTIIFAAIFTHLEPPTLFQYNADSQVFRAADTKANIMIGDLCLDMRLRKETGMITVRIHDQLGLIRVSLITGNARLYQQARVCMLIGP